MENMGIRKLVIVALMAGMVVSLNTEGSRALELCKMSEQGLNACKPAVTQPNPVNPTSECCQALSGADLTCLCSYKNSMVLPALGIDPNLALALPAKCNLAAPSEC